MSGIRFSLDLRDNRAQQLLNALDAHPSLPGKMQFYAGSVPETGATLTDQVLLGTCTLSRPAGTVCDQRFTFAAIVPDDLVDATGHATFVRCLDGGESFVMDLDVTEEAGAGPVRMASTMIYQGGEIAVSSGVIVEGNA